MYAKRYSPHRLFRFFVIALFLVALIQPCLAGNGASMSATYVHNALSLVLPYHAEHAGQGELVVELLSPEDKVLGRVTRTVLASGSGVWRQELATTEPLPFEELIWQRV